MTVESWFSTIDLWGHNLWGLSILLLFFSPSNLSYGTYRSWILEACCEVIFTSNLIMYLDLQSPFTFMISWDPHSNPNRFFPFYSWGNKAERAQGHEASNGLEDISGHLCCCTRVKAHPVFGKLITTCNSVFVSGTEMNQSVKHLNFQNVYCLCRCIMMHTDCFFITDAKL